MVKYGKKNAALAREEKKAKAETKKQKGKGKDD